MNIFYLSPIPMIAARWHCDKHVCKMIIESAQMLSTAHHEHGTWLEGMYKPTHKNHPSNVWTRASRQHYMYVQELAVALCHEFRKRYGKSHKTESLLRGLLADPPSVLHASGWCDPPKAMPEEFKPGDAVTAYQRYYRAKLSMISMRWFRKDVGPAWMYEAA